MHWRTNDVSFTMAVDTAAGVAAPVVAADPATGMNIDTADDLFVDVAVFASASVWGGGDEVTAAIHVDTDATPSAAANDAHASGAAIAGTDTVVEAVPTRKR